MTKTNSEAKTDSKAKTETDSKAKTETDSKAKTKRGDNIDGDSNIKGNGVISFFKKKAVQLVGIGAFCFVGGYAASEINNRYNKSKGHVVPDADIGTKEPEASSEPGASFGSAQNDDFVD